MLSLELALVLLLTLVNGVLSMSELAMVSSRPARLKAMADRGVSGARRALALSSDPGRFLSTVQIGITLVGILAGAFSGATLGDRLSNWFLLQGLPAFWASFFGVGLVVTGITYMSLIFGELVPKQLALKNPERIACFMAPAMTWLSRISYPVVWVLDKSGKTVLKMIGGDADSDRRVTEEEIRTVVAEAESAGVLEPGERQMISSVMRLGDRPVSSVMTPRIELDVIDLSDPLEKNLAIIRASTHSSFPAHEGRADEVIGVIWVKDIATHMAHRDDEESHTVVHESRAFEPAGHGVLDLKNLVRAAPVIPETVDALDAVDMLKKSTVHMGLVHDEYGHFLGVVTPFDILQAITGGFSGSDGIPEAALVPRDDGSLLISGWMPVDDMADVTGITLPAARSYQTAAGLLINAFGKIPVAGEKISIQHWRFEVIDMDGRRVDKILATRQSPSTLRAGDVVKG